MGKKTGEFWDEGKDYTEENLAHTKAKEAAEKLAAAQAKASLEGKVEVEIVDTWTANAALRKETMAYVWDCWDNYAVWVQWGEIPANQHSNDRDGVGSKSRMWSPGDDRAFRYSSRCEGVTNDTITQDDDHNNNYSEDGGVPYE